MSNNDYLMVVHKLSEEDGGGYLAFTPDLPGCMGDGSTQQEAIADLLLATTEWIEEAERLKKEVPQPGSAFQRSSAEIKKMRVLLDKQSDLLKRQNEVIKESTKKLKERQKEIERVSSQLNKLLSEQKEKLEGDFNSWNDDRQIPSLDSTDNINNLSRALCIH